jgi:hypothetical protein
MKLTNFHLIIILALALILCPVLGVCYNTREGFSEFLGSTDSTNSTDNSGDNQSGSDSDSKNKKGNGDSNGDADNGNYNGYDGPNFAPAK